MSMARGRILAVAGSIALIGAAGGAHAQSKPSADEFTVRGDFNAQSMAQQQSKSILWDANKKGSWGIKLDLGRDAGQWKNVEAGAYFRVTPSLRVGGAVGLEQHDGPVRKRDEEAAPKVRLETAFKF